MMQLWVLKNRCKNTLLIQKKKAFTVLFTVLIFLLIFWTLSHRIKQFAQKEGFQGQGIEVRDKKSKELCALQNTICLISGIECHEENTKF